MDDIELNGALGHLQNQMDALIDFRAKQVTAQQLAACDKSAAALRLSLLELQADAMQMPAGALSGANSKALAEVEKTLTMLLV